MRLARLALVGLILALPAVSACGKLGRLERPEPRPGVVRDIDAGAEPLPPLTVPSPKAAEASPK